MDIANNEGLNNEATGSSISYNKAAPQIIENSPTGRFSRFDEEIGSGAYKTVYKAIDNDTGCEVAWNTVKTHGMTKAEKERVRDEIMIIQKLKHPNILHFIKAWHNKNREEVVFITEIMTGGSLRQYLKKIKTPRLKVVKRWCKFILEGLNYLHSQKPFPIIHRDLKCDNIFVSARTGEIRIGDLGLSTFMRSSYNKSVVGTPQYMAPELFEERYGTNVDIYSFGLCILEMCTGEMPYAECKNPMEIYQRVSRRIKPLALEKIGNLDVKEFITLCLTDMDQRPSAEELLNHPFFNNDENDDKNHDVITIIEQSGEQNFANFGEKMPKVEEFQQNSNINEFYSSKDIQLSIKIGVLDKRTGRVVRTKLDFMYNLDSDTPQGVAEEIVSNFALENNYTESIAMIIHKKLSKY